MATIPPMSQIVGQHLHIYEAYFQQADPNRTNSVGSLDAVAFLKKSGLNQTILSQIWGLSDQSGKGYLEKNSFFVALKLIALAQNGQEHTIANLTHQLPPPNLGEMTTSSPAVSSGSPDWAIQAQDKQRYDQLFNSLQPVNGLLSGDKVRPCLMNTKLPMDVLGKIWAMSDIDKDGSLDNHEFCVAMHLVYMSMRKEVVPDTLPIHIIPPAKRKKTLPGAVQVLPVIVPLSTASTGRISPMNASSQSVTTNSTWVVPVNDRPRYETMFKQSDTDLDGLVNGTEIRNIFINSGLQQTVLAYIWQLCDINNTGKLNCEQFCLAMYLISQKIKGAEVPTVLSTDMIPPSMRAAAVAASDTSLLEGGPTSLTSSEQTTNKELETISKEIEDIKKEKMQLEQDKAQCEADTKIRNTEVQSLQKELDAINHTVQQLEAQKGEAQRRLDELDDKKGQLVSSVKELREHCNEEQREIESLRSQIFNQETVVKNQEEEIVKLRTDLNELRQEETSLEQKVDSGRLQLEQVTKKIKENNQSLSQAKSRVLQLEDYRGTLTTALAQYNTLLQSEDLSGPEPTLPPPHSDDHFSLRATAGSSPVSSVSGFSTSSGVVEDFKEDPFRDPFPNTSDPFQNEDPFKNTQPDDPFKGADPFHGSGFSSDPFGEDPFAGNSFVSSSTKSDDPFKNNDPFAFNTTSSGASNTKQGIGKDPFDPFGGSGGGSSLFEITGAVASSDPFGSDPFAPKSSQKESQIPPNLPPKQKKSAPPRPAPPRSKTGTDNKSKSPTSDLFSSFGSDTFGGSDSFYSKPPKSDDPFAPAATKTDSSSSKTSDPFANFADFSPNKYGTSSGSSGLTWATTESEHSETERLQMLHEQEQADLELAIALSQADMGSTDA